MLAKYNYWKNTSFITSLCKLCTIGGYTNFLLLFRLQQRRMEEMKNEGFKYPKLKKCDPSDHMQWGRVVDRLGGRSALVEVGYMHAKRQEWLVQAVGVLSDLTSAIMRHVGTVLQACKHAGQGLLPVRHTCLQGIPAAGLCLGILNPVRFFSHLLLLYNFNYFQMQIKIHFINTHNA